MKKILILSQDSCPKCVVLDQYLKQGLNNQFEDDIEYVTREQDGKLFMSLARHHGIMATPALIIGQDVLLTPDPSNTLAFLEKHGYRFVE